MIIRSTSQPKNNEIMFFFIIFSFTILCIKKVEENFMICEIFGQQDQIWKTANCENLKPWSSLKAPKWVHLRVYKWEVRKSFGNRLMLSQGGHKQMLLQYYKLQIEAIRFWAKCRGNILTKCWLFSFFFDLLCLEWIYQNRSHFLWLAEIKVHDRKTLEGDDCNFPLHFPTELWSGKHWISRQKLGANIIFQNENCQCLHSWSKGLSIYYVIQIGGPERPPPSHYDLPFAFKICNVAIIFEDNPL